MKKLLILSLSLITLNSFALEKPIVELSHSNSLEYTTRFDINKDLGRAWVVVTQIDDSFDEDTYETDFRVKVEGLSYNTETKEIIFIDKKGIESVCGRLKEKRSFFRPERLTLTSNCKIDKEIVTVEYDDGFIIKNVLKARFYFTR